MKKQKLTYTFHDPNSSDVLYKALVNMAADLAIKTVEKRVKEQEQQALDKLVSGE